jgi:hypothetical protein
MGVVGHSGDAHHTAVISVNLTNFQIAHGTERKHPKKIRPSFPTAWVFL